MYNGVILIVSKYIGVINTAQRNAKLITGTKIYQEKSSFEEEGLCHLTTISGTGRTDR